MKYVIGTLTLVYTLVITAIPLALAYALNFYVDLPTLLGVFSWIVAGGVSLMYLALGGLGTLLAFFAADEVSTTNRRRRRGGPLR